MIRLPYIFSSDSLFQADSTLTVKGTASTNAIVNCTLSKISGDNVSFSSVKCNEDGEFEIVFNTPAASYDEYSIKIVCGEDIHLMERVMFGELWLASGQSNMEMHNVSIRDCEKMLDSVAGKNIRIFKVISESADYIFPWDPVTTTPGEWLTSDNREKLTYTSAIGLKFANDLYDRINASADIPVGILDSSWGGTSICGWFPRSAVEHDEYMFERMKKVGSYPIFEKWNECEFRFQQSTAMYNFKIAPLLGVQIRGIIWYQGENECGAEFNNRIYADYLRFYHRTYCELFAADKEHFFMISSLLYPWTYGGSGECCVGYLNDAFVETAVQSPDKFAYIPIADLECGWDFLHNNHPIHPNNKYEVGARFAQSAYVNVYTDEPVQKTPAYLESYEIIENRIRLHFASAGSGIYVNGSSARGLYIAGDDNIYMPAEYEILSADTMDIFSDAVPSPKHAAYAVQSFEPKVNIFAGYYPLSPFHTDKDTFLNIEARPWYDTNETSVWGSKFHDDILDFFNRPVWNPTFGSEICRDTAFTLDSVASIRVEGDSNKFGCYVKSYPYNRLDFQKFSGIEVSLYNTQNLTASLTLEYADKSVTLPFEKSHDLRYGWYRYKAVFDTLPDGEIQKMIFNFNMESDRFFFVNIEKLRLTK